MVKTLINQVALQINSKSGLGSIEQLQEKELSYNNINDIDAALQPIDDFKRDSPHLP